MTQPSPSFAEVFAELTSARGLTPERVREVFAAIFAGAWSSEQIAGFLVGLRFSEDTPEVIAAAASAMREVMVRVDHGHSRLLDTCGTGGDHSKTLNLSTGAALIVASTGVPVAKHGNRAATSQAGSADVLEALGIPLDVPPAAQGDVLREANIAFLFAQAHHPAMRHANPVRRQLGIRTLFNCLGPLANPAGATHQLLGAFDDAVRPVLAAALATLGTSRAWVVRSTDGMDEVSPFAATRVTAVDAGRIDEFEITPEDFGIPRLKHGSVDGGLPADNARVLELVLSGEPHASTDAFILNAAAALVVFHGLSPRDAAARAREAVETGAGLKTLDRFRASAKRAREKHE